jgi:hypothetical protein
MDALPRSAQRRQICQQGGLDAGQCPSGKPEVLAKLNQGRRAIQLKYGLVAVPDHMNMGRAVVV